MVGDLKRFLRYTLHLTRRIAAARGRTHRLEALTMYCARPVAIERLVVLRRAVALVRGETILRIDRIEARHHLVALHFRVIRRGIDARAPRVSVDDGFEAAFERQPGERRAAIAVDLHVRWMHAQSDERSSHGEVRRFQDVVSIDLLDVRPRNRPRKRAADRKSTRLNSSHVKISY